MLQCLGEVLNRRVGVALLNTLAYAVAEMSFKDDKANTVQRAVGSTELGKDVLAGNILAYHLLNTVQLSDDSVDPDLERVCISHTVPHAVDSFL